MIAMRVHSSCTSLRMWELKRTVFPPLVQLLDDPLDLDPADRVEAGHRLVQQHQVGVVDERLGDAHPLQHPLGVLAQVRVGRSLEPDVAEELLDALSPATRLESEQAGAEPEELAAGEIVVEVRVLRQVAHVRHARHAQLDRAGAGPHEPERHLDRGRLAGAVGSEQSEHVVRTDLEVDASEDDDLLPAEADVDGLVKVADAQRALLCHAPPRLMAR